MFALRRLLHHHRPHRRRRADPELHGFGLYDREVIELVRRIDDPYPYFADSLPISASPMPKCPSSSRGADAASPRTTSIPVMICHAGITGIQDPDPAGDHGRLHAFSISLIVAALYLHTSCSIGPVPLGVAPV